MSTDNYQIYLAWRSSSKLYSRPVIVSTSRYHTTFSKSWTSLAWRHCIYCTINRWKPHSWTSEASNHIKQHYPSIYLCSSTIGLLTLERFCHLRSAVAFYINVQCRKGQNVKTGLNSPWHWCSSRMTLVFLDIDIGDKDAFKKATDQYAVSEAFYKHVAPQVMLFGEKLFQTAVSNL